MKKYTKALSDSFVDLVITFFKFDINLLKTLTSLYSLWFPYVCLFIGEYVCKVRNGFSIGGEIFFPLVIFIIICYVKKFLNRIGKGERIPVPESRFTVVSDDGEITMERERLEELMVYVSELEDYLENKGLL